MDPFLVVQAVRQFLDYRKRGLFKSVYPVTNHCEFCGGPRRGEQDGGICNSCTVKLKIWLDTQLSEKEDQDRRDYEEHMRVHHADGSPCAPVDGRYKGETR